MNAAVHAVLTIIINHGYEAYVVGGFVRDHIVGTGSDDVDITTNATPSQLKEIFPQTIDIGIDHGSIRVKYQERFFDVTTYRHDGTYANHRHPDAIEFGESLVDDVNRRDFTMNAIAMDAQGKLIDHVGGMKDIEQKIIRAIGDPDIRLQEDALRIIRALRFVSVLGFELEESLFQAMTKHQALVMAVSVERVQDELTKLIQGPYLNKVNQYLQTAIFPRIPRQFTLDPRLSLVEQLVIAEKTNHGSAEGYSWTRKERQLLEELRVIKENIPTPYELYKSRDADALIRVGTYVYQWDEHALQEMKDRLPIRTRSELNIRGTDIAAMGYQGAQIEEQFVFIEQAVLNEKYPNTKTALLQYIKGNNHENRTTQK